MLRLFLLFTVLPAADFYLLIKVGQNIGAWETVWIVLMTGFLGAYMARSQGLQILVRIQQEALRGEMPTKSLFHGLLIFVGGVLLITPGFITDSLGFLMLIPWCRSLLLFFLKNQIFRQMQNGRFHIYTGGTYTNPKDSQQGDHFVWRDVTPEEFNHNSQRPLTLNETRQLKDVTPKENKD